MSRFDYDSSDQKILRYIKEGKGQGRGADYQPWLNVHSIASRGRVSRIIGWKTGRVHHFLTDNEVRYFYLCEWSDCIDVRENYPLLDLYEMAELLDDELLKKLTDRKTGTPHILTSTFLITIKNEQGQEKHFARNIKESRELEKPGVIDRYEVIRRYWNKKAIPWALISPSEINTVRAKNIEWIHASRRLSDWGYSEEQVEGVLCQLIDMLSSGEETIRCVIDRFENEIRGDRGNGLLLFKHLLATKRIKMDMDKPIDLNQPTEIIKVGDCFTKGSDTFGGISS